MNNYCCSDLQYQLEQTCDIHDKYGCPDVVLIKEDNGDIGISIKDGGTSYLKIDYCPFCGSKLDE